MPKRIPWAIWPTFVPTTNLVDEERIIRRGFDWMSCCLFFVCLEVATGGGCAGDIAFRSIFLRALHWMKSISSSIDMIL